jgi:hypothetical protein
LEGKSAEPKIPPFAKHPREQKITNITLDAECEHYTPVFDKEGREALIGDISCPSCHNPHRWSSFSQEKGERKNLEGSAKSSFLRSPSYRNSCMECHGKEGLFRYRLFHPVDKRRGSDQNQRQ